MSWSRVEFERKEIVVCENVGQMSVSLRRHGDLTHSAYVSIIIREISATKGEDFTTGSGKQVQFDPGQSVLSCLCLSRLLLSSTPVARKNDILVFRATRAEVHACCKHQV